jgi:carboxyl-terminal processing protease
VLVLLALLAGRPAAAASTLTCGDLPDLVALYLQKHLSFRTFSPELEQRTVENYLRRLDPQRVLLLEPEAEQLTQSLRTTMPRLRTGDCERLRLVQEQVLRQHQEAEGFVRKYVGREDYAIDPKAELVFDPEKRGRPRTRQEREVLLRALVHFQVSNYLAAGHDLADAKQRLIHRYELITRRFAEQTREEIYAAFLDSFSNALDPHSGYLSADDLEDFRIGMQLSLEGIGVALSERDGYSVVEQIIPGGAADRLDVLRPKDKIIAVGEDASSPVDVIDMPLREVVRLIRGKKGSRVHLTVLRQGERTERFPITIVRDRIDLEQQAAKLRFEKVPAGERTLKLAVLDLPSFYGDRDANDRLSSRDVARHLGTVVAEKADGLVLDLSRNGGGLLDEAVDISGFFVREGGVVAIKDATGRARVSLDPDRGILYSGPLVVLTSRVSASAAEILAGALDDYQRAVIVGDDHTFGKGSVQSVIPLRPGLGALKVTTALYFRPGGASTQNTGVNADVVIPSFFNTDAFGEKNQPHSLPPQSIPPFLSASANYDSGPRHWRPVTPELLGQLAVRSRTRVEGSEEFKAIEKQLAERAGDDGVMLLDDILREREEAGQKAGANATAAAAGDAAIPPPAETADSDDEPTPQLREALAILADLVQLTPS